MEKLIDVNIFPCVKFQVCTILKAHKIEEEDKILIN